MAKKPVPPSPFQQAARQMMGEKRAARPHAPKHKHKVPASANSKPKMTLAQLIADEKSEPDYKPGKTPMTRSALMADEKQEKS